MWMNIRMFSFCGLHNELKIIFTIKNSDSFYFLNVNQHPKCGKTYNNFVKVKKNGAPLDAKKAIEYVNTFFLGYNLILSDVV